MDFILLHLLPKAFINGIIHTNDVSLHTFKKHLNPNREGFFSVALIRSNVDGNSNIAARDYCRQQTLEDLLLLR